MQYITTEISVVSTVFRVLTENLSFMQLEILTCEKFTVGLRPKTRPGINPITVLDQTRV